MLKQRVNSRLAMPLLLLAAALPALPVTIQYSGSNFLGGSGNLTGVADLGGCSGALMADGIHVLTAAHCVATASTNLAQQTILTPNGLSSLAFFTAADPGGFVDAITGVQLNPLTALMFPADPGYGLLEYDIAIIDLATPAPADATRYNLDLSGFGVTHAVPVTLGGWGFGGYPGGNISGTAGSRRGGTNTTDGYFGSASDPNLPPAQQNITLPDTPIALQWTTTSDVNNPNDTTGLGNSGDSGSPLLYNGNVIGILDFGSLPNSGVLPIGTTYQNGYADLANPGNANFIESVLNGTPEPGTWTLGASGLLMVLTRRRVANWFVRFR
jgi:hypothetical protein